MIYGSVLLRFGIVLNSEFSLENIYCSVEIVAGLIRQTLRVACVIFHLLLCALLLPTFQRTSINSTPTHIHTRLPRVQLINFSWAPLTTVGNRRAQAHSSPSLPFSLQPLHNFPYSYLQPVLLLLRLGCSFLFSWHYFVLLLCLVRTVFHQVSFFDCARN